MTTYYLGSQNAAACDFVIPFQNNFYGFGIDTVLFFQDAGAESFFGVAVFDRNHRLHDDWAGIEIFVDEMHGAAGEFYPVVEGLPLRFQPGKRRKQRRMNIQNALRKSRHEKWRKQSHVPGKTDEIDLRFAQCRDCQTIVSFAFEALGRYDAGGQSAGTGTIDSWSAFAIAENESDFGVGYAACGNAIGQRLKIGAAAAQEHANAFGDHGKKLAQLQRGSQTCRNTLEIEKTR